MKGGEKSKTRDKGTRKCFSREFMGGAGPISVDESVQYVRTRVLKLEFSILYKFITG